MQNIVADMRKVLAKNPQVEQQKLHRRVFLDNINPENQALMVRFDSLKHSRREYFLLKLKKKQLVVPLGPHLPKP